MIFNTVWFPLLYECNNKCNWCYTPSNKTAHFTKRFNDKKEGEFIDLVYDLEIKKIILIGGEPSIYPSLDRVIKRIKDKKMGVSMVTNGRKLVDLDFSKSVYNSGLDSVTISVEGSNPEIHDYTTKVSGSFYETIQGIENAQKVGIPVSTETTMNKDNKNDLENIVEFLEEKDLSYRLFNICGPCISDLKDSNFTLTLKEGAKMFERVYKKAKKKNIRLVTPVPVCFFEKEFYEDMKKNNAISHGCHILFGSNFVLEGNGDILPCVHFSNYPIFNVYENGKIISSTKFKEIYNDPKGDNIKFRKILRKYPSTKCEEDGCWNPCTGGCSVFWLKDDPQKEIKGWKN